MADVRFHETGLGQSLITSTLEGTGSLYNKNVKYLQRDVSSTRTACVVLPNSKQIHISRQKVEAAFGTLMK